MGEATKDPRRYSRRDVLTRVPLAVIGGVVLGVVLGKPLISRVFRRRQAAEFPKGSIFTPADDAQRRT